jgi:glycerol kinase
VSKNWALQQEFRPQMPSKQREEHYRRWRKAVQRSLAWEDAEA